MEAIAEQGRSDRKKYFFALERTEDGIVVGEVGISIVFPKVADIGWFIQKEYQGKGYATEGAKLMISFSLSVGIERLQASCLEENYESKRVMEKSGFQIARISESRIWYDLNLSEGKNSANQAPQATSASARRLH
ncbi:acetyltransferase, GNAT family [Verrucomicrobiia bacterium DG1235]|nr:acetyltransferase, GNAT family [Verrucomicrobiae bacterium DG1235]